MQSPSGIKSDIKKCHFRVRQAEFLGRKISPEEISPRLGKLKLFLTNSDSPNQKKTLQRYLGFVKYYRNFILRMAEKLCHFHILLRTEVPINITSELKDNFDSANEELADACELALKQSNSRETASSDDRYKLQKCWLCSHGRIQSWPKKSIEAENVRPSSVRIKDFLPSATNQNVNLLGNFLAIYMAYLAFVQFGGKQQSR